MNPLIQFKTITLSLLITFVLGCLMPIAQAVSPPPDGGYANFNTAEGQSALNSLTSGSGNTAIGAFSLFSVTTGSNNTGVGAGTLTANTGHENAAVGTLALFLNSTGTHNTAHGAFALFNNTTGSDGTAVGDRALQSTSTGGNTAVGSFALGSNTTGGGNTAGGFGAIGSNTTGKDNTGFGWQVLANSTGHDNIGLGNKAGVAFTTGSFNIDIGNQGDNTDSNTIRIGTPFDEEAVTGQSRCFIAGIRDQSAIGGDAVFVTSGGKLGTITAVSSQRFKDDIKAMDKDSEAIFAFKPVTFCYKKEIEASGIRQFGLVAEQVEKVAPELVKRDHEGKPYTVRYEAVNAMLLNEFLKEHRKVQRLEAALAAVNKRLKAQDAKIDRVNAKVELAKPAPQTVAENR